VQGTGLSWFVGGLRFREQKAHTTAMKSIVSLTMITVFPFIPPMFIGPLYEAFPQSTALFTLTVAEVIVMLVIYAMWLCFRYNSHAALFEELEETDAGSTADDGSPTSGAVNGRFSGQEDLSTASRLNYAFRLIAILVLQIQCSVYLIQDIPRFVQDTSLSHIFIGAALLPFTSSLSSFAKTCAIAYDDRMELAMHLTAETALGVGLFNLPILIIASVCIGHRMLLDFDLLLEVYLFITAVTTAFTTGYGLFTYLKGAIHLGLYVPPPAPNDLGFIRLTQYRYIIIVLALYIY
jgi:Ca2+:H+ antiporter